MGKKKSLRRTKHFVERKKLTISILDLQWSEGVLMNTVEHPLPVLTSPRPTTTFYKRFGNSKYAHTIEIQGGTKKMETWCHIRYIKKCLRFEKKMRAKDIYVSRSALLLSQLFELAAKKIVCEHLAAVVDSFLSSVHTSSLGNPNF